MTDEESALERLSTRLLDRMDKLADQFRQDIRDLDNRYPSKNDLTNLSSLLAERQTGWEKQMDQKFIAYDDEMRMMRGELKSMEDNAGENRRILRNAVLSGVFTVVASVSAAILTLH